MLHSFTGKIARNLSDWINQLKTGVDADRIRVKASALKTKACLDADHFVCKRHLTGRFTVTLRMSSFQGSEIRDQRSGVRDQRSEIRDQFVQRSFDFLYFATREGYFRQLPAVRPAAFGAQLHVKLSTAKNRTNSSGSRSLTALPPRQTTRALKAWEVRRQLSTRVRSSLRFQRRHSFLRLAYKRLVLWRVQLD